MKQVLRVTGFIEREGDVVELILETGDSSEILQGRPGKRTTSNGRGNN